MASASTKRKRGVDEQDKISLKLSALPPTQLGPILVSFPALQPPTSTSFQCYINKEQEGGDVPFAAQDTVVAGETDTVEFFTSTESARASVGCSYMIGVHNKRTKTTILRPAPLHVLTRQVKALKNLESLSVSTDERASLRNKLGETFGTKKAKAAIRAAERNRVDIDAMQGVTSHLQDRIQANTASLPTQEEVKASADSSRLIPPYNAEATKLEDAYPLYGIIPEAEYKALSLSAMCTAEDHNTRVAMLPHSRSHWINDHLRLLFSAPKLNKKHTKILLYISVMFAFKMMSRKVNDKQALQEKLSGVSSIIIDGLLSRFTENARNTTTAQTTTQTETNLLTHMFALCLRIDDFATDTAALAADLSMPVLRVNTLFKSLGCKLSKLDQKDLKKLGLPESAAMKRATLSLPLQFPKPRVRRRGG